MSSEAQKIDLRTDVQNLTAVGPSRSLLLRRLGIRRAADLLFFFPRSYEEPASLIAFADFSEGLRATCYGRISEIDQRITQSGKHMLGVLLDVGGGAVRAVWFNQPFRAKGLCVGLPATITGVLRSAGVSWEMIQPQVTLLEEGQEPTTGEKPLPVYPLTEGLKQHGIRQMMRSALPSLIEISQEALPQKLRKRLSVPAITEALQSIHFPVSLAAAELAKRRFKLQELLVLQLAIMMQRQQRELDARAPACPASGKIHARILRRLPHEPTADQMSAIDDIAEDMAKATPMNRLLQGDVGSGKTVVAQYAMLLAVANGTQAAMMAPTEVLARQHVKTLTRALASSRVRVDLLTASMSRSERLDTLERCKLGEVDVLVGTQALLSDDVAFHRLGLVVVDEQHKFGVMQRAKLRTDETQPHYLVLSATPIPRTIAMTAFGDLDVSSIRTKPPGRAAVHTYVANESQVEAWWRFVDKQIEAGRQAYVIAPRVSSDGTDDRANVEEVYSGLASGSFAHRRVGLMHGRMDGVEKENALRDFADGTTQVLVATTVVEVGIDVPNATVMTILDADRLGLSQLHQLRGRVARGSHAGYVTAVTSSGVSEDNQRLAAFQKTDDGFELAEMDLKMRGPGDLLGTSQSGLPSLRVASIVDDADLLLFAKEVARELLADDPKLASSDLQVLREQTLRRYGERMQLSDVG